MKTVTVRLKNGDNTSFRFAGIASSESRDSYGEIIKQQGIDLTLVEQGKAIVTAEHGGTTIGKIEYAAVRNGQLYLEGVVFLKTIMAKRFYELLKDNSKDNPVTLSIEGVNPEYSKTDRSTLTEIILTGVALVGLEAEPANKDTFAKLLKSISKQDLLAELMRRAEGSPDFKIQLQRILAKFNP